ncbi:MAG TPA: translational GTPase TypA [Firmicutes bacterium]|nr:translational GTPase TypA [Bacillota bacterium]
MIRNIAIIAHVDHGKTTLVDAMLKQSSIFHVKEQVQERVMDSLDLERERGITIMAKFTGIFYKGTKINIVDTPGHSDFGGEVERTLSTVDGVLLLVDAAEGPLAQTKYVLQKALGLGLKPIVVINKIDRQDARPLVILDKCLDLFIELGADEDQLDFPVLYASARAGFAKHNLEDENIDLTPLFEAIISEIPAPKGDQEAPLQMLVSSIDWDDYVGRIAIGRVQNGNLTTGQTVAIIDPDGSHHTEKIAKLYQFIGLDRAEQEGAQAGDIAAIVGLEEVSIGCTLTDPEHMVAIPFVKVDEPTVTMDFLVNDSPLAGQEGKYVTTRHLRDRLHREAYANISMRVEDGETADTWHVSGRGELHLAILIETMRREGYEFAVSRPRAIFKEDEQGRVLEPLELLSIEVPEEFLGATMERLGSRHAKLLDMNTSESGTVHLEYDIPARSLLGFRSQFLTETKGYGVMNHIFNGYGPYRPDIPKRNHGVLVAYEAGVSTVFGLYQAEDRGTLFIEPGTKVYEGMIVGETGRSQDIDINVTKKKHLTSLRSAGAEEAMRLSPPPEITLEKALEYIESDELIEITPKNMRMRKRILDRPERLRRQKWAEHDK